MGFKRYNGNDKYHFRIYKHGKSHPMVVAVVEEREENGKIYLSRYMFTHSALRVLDRPNDYVKMDKNPNPNDDSDSYLCLIRVNNADSSSFSKPYPNWHLSEKDEHLIDALEEKIKNRY